MARKRTIILLKTEPTPTPGGGTRQEMIPLGNPATLIADFGRYNIAPDGSGPRGWGSADAMIFLHGPGMVVEVPAFGGDAADIAQAMVTLTDEEFAWPVLARLCKDLRWTMMDPDSGRTFG
jgi:hypothetical protein